MTDLRYPIGEFALPAKLSPSERPAAIRDIEEAPTRLRAAVAGLSEDQLDTPYRPGGWTVRQVVHHLPDSHLNSYVRLKLALTEEVPTIRPFDEAAWAELPDSTMSVEVSLALLERLHQRWVYLWQRLTEADWDRKLYHPELGELGVDELCALYAWHGKHHVAHITSLRAREAW
jgi:hypothetical protein